MGSLEGPTAQADESNCALGNTGSAGPSSERCREQRTKVIEILACCQGPLDHDQLARLATSTNGLVNDEVRRLACMSGPSLFDKPS